MKLLHDIMAGSSGNMVYQLCLPSGRDEAVVGDRLQLCLLYANTVSSKSVPRLRVVFTLDEPVERGRSVVAFQHQPVYSRWTGMWFLKIHRGVLDATFGRDSSTRCRAALSLSIH